MSDLEARQAIVQGPKAAWAGGLALFGASVMIMLGFFQLSEGFSAVLSDDVFPKSPRYAYALNLTAWGWIHMILGVVAIVVGAYVLMSRTWALIAGIVIAVVSAVANFLFLPQSQSWSLVSIALNVAVLWAFCEVISENRKLAALGPPD